MQGIFKKLTAGVASAALVAVLFATPSNAEAGRRYGSSGSSGSSSSHGSSGSSGGSSSSHGSSGSSGGSSSSHGSSGSSGSRGWRHHGSSSSHGSSGSSGGSSSSHGSSGSSGGSYSSHGSSGSSAVVVAPATAAIETEAINVATVAIKVPADAAVYLADQKMSLTGKERKFRIPVAQAGKDYIYSVRVEIVRDGKTLVSKSEHKIRGGQNLNLAVAESVEEGKLVQLAKN